MGTLISLCSMIILTPVQFKGTSFDKVSIYGWSLTLLGVISFTSIGTRYGQVGQLLIVSYVPIYVCSYQECGQIK